MKLFKKAKKGFTLVELVVVIAVIAILAAVSVGAYFGVTESAKNSKADQEAKQFHTAVMLVVNDPDSGITFNKDSGLGGTLASFDAQIEKMSGLIYGIATVTISGSTTTVSIADEEGVTEAGYYVVPEAGHETIKYVSTDKLVREIDIATGNIK